MNARPLAWMSGKKRAATSNLDDDDLMVALFATENNHSRAPNLPDERTSSERPHVHAVQGHVNSDAILSIAIIHPSSENTPSHARHRQQCSDRTAKSWQSADAELPDSAMQRDRWDRSRQGYDRG